MMDEKTFPTANDGVSDKVSSRPLLFFLRNLHHRGLLKASLILLLIGVLLAFLQLALAGLSWVFIDYLLQGRVLDWKGYLIAGLFSIFLLVLLLNYLKQKVMDRFYLRLSLYYTTEFFWRAVSLPFSFFLNKTGNEAALKIHLVDPFIQSLVTLSLQGVLNVLLSFIFAVALFYFDTFIAFTALFIVIINILFILYLYVFRQYTYSQYEKSIDKSQSCIISSLRRMDTIKEAGIESYFFSLWAGFYTKAVNAIQKIARRDIFSGAFPAFFENFANLGILFLGVWKIMKGELSIGMLFAILVIARSFMNPTFTLLGMMPQFQRLKIDLDRLNVIFNAQKSPLQKNGDSPIPIVRENSTSKLEGNLEVKNLIFGYETDTKPILNNISFSLTPGKIIALIGPTGSGKSVLIRLLAGHYEPWSGEILFDSKLRKDIPKSFLCHSLSIVEQETILFSESIKDNITLMESFPIQSDLIQAARDVLLHSVIMKKKGGYEFRLDSDANNLSAGEKDQLQIARALYRNPSLLLLDEATNSLDATTENEVFRNIRRRGCACLVATHNYNIIKQCDEVLVLQNGSIIQHETPKELVNIPGYYLELAKQAQKRSGVIDNEQ